MKRRTIQGTALLALSLLLSACSAAPQTEEQKPEQEEPRETNTIDQTDLDHAGEVYSLEQNTMIGFEPEEVRILPPVVNNEYSDQSIEQVLESAELVFSGKITEVSYTISTGSAAWTTATITVDTPLKGDLKQGDKVLFYKNQSFLPLEDYLNSLPESRRSSVEQTIQTDEEEAAEIRYVQTVSTNDVMLEPGQRVLLALRPSAVFDLDGSYEAVPGSGSELYTLDRENWMEAAGANSLLNQSWDARRDYSGLVDPTVLPSWTLDEIKSLLKPSSDEKEEENSEGGPESEENATSPEEPQTASEEA